MNKTLKFKPCLVAPILSGTKTSTWRLWDDKNIQTGDELDFLDSDTKEKFASVRVLKVLEKPIGQLSVEEKSGHETYRSDEEMYQILGGYYGKPVDATTPVKVIWFEIKIKS